MFKIYPVSLSLAVVAIGATGSGVSKVLKITDGPFRWDRLGIAAYDANGALVPNPNISLKIKKAGFNVFADDVSIATLQRADQPTFPLPEAFKINQNEELTFIATGQSGSQVTVLNLTLIGDEAAK